MIVLVALLNLALVVGAGAAVLGLAGYALALWFKHTLPARPSWRQLLDSLRMED